MANGGSLYFKNLMKLKLNGKENPFSFKPNRSDVNKL